MSDSIAPAAAPEAVSTAAAVAQTPTAADAFVIGDHIQVLMKESGGTSWYWRNATVASVAADGYNVIFYKASTEQVFFEKSKTRALERTSAGVCSLM